MLLITILAAAAPQFPVPLQVESQLRPSGKVLAPDLNGDGNPDVVRLRPGSFSVGYQGDMQVFLSDGASGFEAPFELDVLSGNGVVEPDVVDLDGDGDIDIVAVVWNGGGSEYRVDAWLNLGGGAFAPPIVVFAGGANEFIVRLQLAVGDLNSDGFEDLVLSYATFTNAHVELFAGPLTSPAVGTPLLPAVSSGEAVGLLLVADLDGDGFDDLAYGDDRDVYWRKGDGQGALATSANGPFVPSYNPAGLSAFDENGDGMVDLVIRSEGLVIIDWIPDPFWMPSLTGRPTAPLVPVYGDAGEICVVRGAGSGPAGICQWIVTGRGRMVDVDGDGDRDALVIPDDQPNSNNEEVLMLAEALGGGVYGAPVTQIRMGSRFNDLNDLVGADMDVDGVDDLLLSEEIGTIDVARASVASGVLEVRRVSSIVSVVDARGTADARDYNGDGVADIVVEGGLADRIVGFAGLGGGAFAPGETVIEYAGDNFANAGTWIDVADDGDLDYVVRDAPASELLVHTNDGAGQFEGSSLLPLSGVYVDQLRAFDMDADGDDDLVFLDEREAVFGWYRQDATGGFALATSMDLGFRSSHFAIGDVNGDGIPDAVTNGLTTIAGGSLIVDRVALHLGTVSGAFAPSVPLADVYFADPARDPYALFMVDVDDDGDLDVLRSGRRDGFPPTNSLLEIMSGDGQGNFASRTLLFETDTIPQAMVDIDGDGTVDLLAHDTSFSGSGAASIYWFRGTGNLSFGLPQRLISDGDTIVSAFPADFDFDGDIDLITLRGTVNRIETLEFKSLGNVGYPYCSAAVENSTGAVGDLQATGSAQVSDAALTLEASALPPFTFGLFVTGTEPASTPISNSAGVLCVGGQLGRFVMPGQVQSADASGAMSLTISPAALPAGGMLVSASAGESRYFQLWHRDLTPSGAQTSNLTRAVRVLMY